jgi:ketosteroid isomerase-like protein
MTNLQTIADRFEIEALRGEFTDAGMTHDYDRFASLFTPDGSWHIPHAGIDYSSRQEIRAGIEKLQEAWEFFVQNPHPGTIRLEGDTAIGRSYVAELGRFRDGKSQSNYAVYADRYRRTLDGWKFRERVYQVLYVDSSPLAGTAPNGRGGW